MSDQRRAAILKHLGDLLIKAHERGETDLLSGLDIYYMAATGLTPPEYHHPMGEPSKEQVEKQ